MELLWLGQTECHDIDLVGGKVAQLSRLAIDHRVPPGFCLTTNAFEQWSTSIPNYESTPDSLHELLTLAYRTLATHEAVDEPAVAVRSSAVDEDGKRASFAGQYESYLGRVGVDAVLNAVQLCWASARSEQVLAYRQQQGVSSESLQLAVLVQLLVKADSSAVAFSINPVTGNRKEVVINASWGLGESIVGGTVTPDTYSVHKADGTLTNREIAQKQCMTVTTPGGSEEVAVPRFLQNQSTLTDAQATEIAHLALSLETEMGWPVDIECAYHGQELYLLQCRPVTTLG